MGSAVKPLATELSVSDHAFQEDEWQINETYMDNISKYPKDWYKQLMSKKKPKEGEKTERAKGDKRHSIYSVESGKEGKNKPEPTDNDEGADDGNKVEEDKEAVKE